MSLLDRVNARTWAARADAVTLEEFGYLLGQTTSTGNIGGPTFKTRSGTSIGAARALGISSWYSGVRYLSETIASLPVKVYRESRGVRRKRADPQWLRRPDKEMPRFGLFEGFMVALLHRGNAYAFKLRDGLGRVTGLRYLHPDRVRVGQADDGTKVFQLDGGTPASMAFTTREILHIPALSYDGVVGIDPIRYHAENLGTIAAADEYAGRHFGQGSHVQAYLSVPQVLSTKQANELKSQWEAFHRGIANAHEFGVLGGGAEYKTITLDPQQQQLLESRQYGVLEVARILRVPPQKLFELERQTHSNIEAMNIDAVTDAIRPWAERIEEWVDFDPDLMPGGNFIEFNLDGLMRGDAKSRAEYYHYGITDGWMNRSEPRDMEGLEPVGGLDAFLVPQNTALLRPDGSIQPINQPDPAPAPKTGGGGA